MNTRSDDLDELLEEMRQKEQVYLESTVELKQILQDHLKRLNQNKHKDDHKQQLLRGDSSAKLILKLITQHPGMNSRDLKRFVTEQYKNIPAKFVANGLFLLKKRGLIKKLNGVWHVQ